MTVTERNVMNPERAAKIAAKRIGVPLDVYLEARRQGKRWCGGCRTFHSASEFSGTNKLCREARGQYVKHLYSQALPRKAERGARGRPPSCTFAEVAPLFQAGKSISEIARTLGCSYWSVRRELLDRGATRAFARKAEIKTSHRRQYQVISGLPPLSLGAPVMDGDRERYDIARLPSMPSAADEVLRDQSALTLRQVVGDMTPEDVQRMSAWDLDRLRERLADAGFTPEGVQETERDRLRLPAKHTNVGKAPLNPGRKKRHQKIEHKAANRARGNSNRPSQKPRKRWARAA